MKIYKPFEKEVPTRGVATLGFFDGVHIGHKAILQKVINEAEQSGSTPLLLTLWPHPRMVLRKDNSNILLINTLEEKTGLLARYGMEHFVVIPFTEALAEYSAEEFFKKYFVEWLNIRKLIVGYDHHIGKNGSGDFETMLALGRKYNIEVERVDAMKQSDISISSTKIRKLVEEGDVRGAASFLGYSYFITGNVVMGFQLGRKIGFPTANIEVNDQHKLIPADGVYAVVVEGEGFKKDGMINIGYRPTISKDQHKTIEVNIFDFDQSIYGTSITVRFVERIRSEMKFDGIEMLKEQLAKDKQTATAILKKSQL